MTSEENVRQFLPEDGFAGVLIGRVWTPAAVTGSIAGPSPVLLSEDGVFDLSAIAPTCGDLLNDGFMAADYAVSQLPRLGGYDEIMTNTMVADRDDAPPFSLAYRHPIHQSLRCNVHGQHVGTGDRRAGGRRCIQS